MVTKRTRTRKCLTFISCLLALMLLTGIAASAGTTFYVANSGSDANAGTNSTFPKQHIQTAINASVSGDTVLVANGIYTGASNKDLDFAGRNITVQSVSGDPTLCIIDCQKSGRGFYIHSGETPTAVVEGFTIQNADPGNNWGGGMAISTGSNPTVSHCIFRDNFDENGGGLIIYEANPTITDCTFIHNSNSIGWGGGIDIYHSAPTIANCKFFGNSAVEGGGALHIRLSTVTITNCVFVGNRDHYGGNAIYIEEFSVPTITNCTFSSNGVGAGHGIFISNNSLVTITNSIHRADTGGEFLVDSSSRLQITFSDVQSWQSGNMNTDPLFLRNPSPGPDGLWGTADDDFGDLHLQADSPCINVGSNAAVSSTNLLDPNGSPRIRGGTVDLGAYEASLALLRGGIRYNRATGRFVQTVVLYNYGPAVTGPISLALDGLDPTVTLFNLSGKTSASLPAGSPYLDVMAGNMDAATSVSVTLEFSNPNNKPITYSARLLMGAVSR